MLSPVAKFKKKYFRKKLTTKQDGGCLSDFFSLNFFKEEKDMVEDATMLARACKMYALMIQTDKGFTFVPCNCMGRVDNLYLLEGLRIKKVLGMNAILIAS